MDKSIVEHNLLILSIICSYIGPSFVGRPRSSSGSCRLATGRKMVPFSASHPRAGFLGGFPGISYGSSFKAGPCLIPKVEQNETHTALRQGRRLHLCSGEGPRGFGTQDPEG